jgi:crotonobetaine/carnitine-CoA ligase
MCTNRAQVVETLLGCGWIGAVMVPINTASMGPQIEYVLRDSGAKLLVIEAQFVARVSSSAPPMWVVEDWPAAGEAVDVEAIHPGDPLAILYTSGTTGPAKGVVCPHAQFCWWGVNTADVLGVTSADVLCTTLPLFHVNALNTVAQAAVTGCRVHFLDKFSASASGPRCGAATRPSCTCWARWCHPARAAAGPGEREHRVRIGLGPGVPAAAGERSAAAPA